MTTVVGSVLFVVLVWWFSTGAVLMLCRLNRLTYVWSFAMATIILVVAMVGLALASRELSAGNVIVSFCCVIAIWAWHEMAFLFGYLTGPRRTACPDGSCGWTRFWLAFNALKHHELALLATFAAVVFVCWDGPNYYGMAAFAVLWLMRISAKLNIYFGVPHFSDEMLPPHLEHLSSYFRVAPIGAFYVATMLVSGGVALGLLWVMLAGPELGAAHGIGLVVVLSLLLLAILEHGFMAVPVRDTALWRWAMIEIVERMPANARVTEKDGDQSFINNQSRGTGIAQASLRGAPAKCLSVGGMKNGL
ncbi:MAG: DUF3623 domain-containing protein [Alphaproteobacteria bacterium]|nr:DUF3623 domain-containing protein [Alphaproteobacteria bacterium]